MKPSHRGIQALGGAAMSELEFRSDFDDVKQNWRRFWAGTLGRPILLAQPPKTGVEPVAKPPWGAAFTRDGEQVVDQLLRWAETHEFLGDAVPFGCPSLIIDLLPALLGAEITSVTESWVQTPMRTHDPGSELRRDPVPAETPPGGSVGWSWLSASGASALAG